MAAKVIHTQATLDDAIQDLHEIIQDLIEVRDGMTGAKIDQIPIGYDAMQERSREWLHKFAWDGQQALQLAILERKKEAVRKAKGELNGPENPRRKSRK